MHGIVVMATILLAITLDQNLNVYIPLAAGLQIVSVIIGVVEGIHRAP